MPFYTRLMAASERTVARKRESRGLVLALVACFCSDMLHAADGDKPAHRTASEASVPMSAHTRQMLIKRKWDAKAARARKRCLSPHSLVA